MKICQIYYDASHYRETIYREIDKTFDSDIVFGIPPSLEGVKQMNTEWFKGRVFFTRIISWRNVFYQKGIIPLIWKPYDVYIGMGETHGISSWIFPILVRLFKPKKKVYFWSHGWYGKESKFEGFIKKIFFKLPNGGTFLYGDYARNLMIKEGLPAEKLFVIHNSLAYYRQLEIRNSITRSEIYKEYFGNDNKVIVMIGRLNLRKHLDMLIDALSIAKSQGVFYNLVLIGNGEDREKLDKLSVQKGVESQIWFYGACYDEYRNAELIYNADLCVVPGDIGLTAIHSLMFGTPAISHNHYPTQGPEFEAIKPGITGDFYEYGDVKSLTITIQKWFETHKNRDDIRQACFNEIDKNWTPDFQIQVLKKYLN